MNPAIGYAALILAIGVCVRGYANNGNVGCVVLAAALAAFGLIVWGRNRGRQ